MYLSHTKPDKRLVVHLREVYEYLKTLLEYVPLSREDYETVQYIGKIVAVTHDFGKYLSYFQTYLRTKETEGDLHHHSFISAVFAAHLLCRSKSLPASWSEFAPLLGYFAVMHHHGNLRDIALDVTDSNDIYEDDVQRSLYDRVRTLKIQLEDIKSMPRPLLRIYRHYGRSCRSRFSYLKNLQILYNIMRTLLMKRIANFICLRAGKEERLRQNYIIMRCCYTLY